MQKNYQGITFILQLQKMNRLVCIILRVHYLASQFYIEIAELFRVLQGFGVEFNDENFIDALEEMINNYPELIKCMKDYPYTSDKMCSEYIELFKKLIYQREFTVSKRKIFRNPIKLLINLLFL